VTEAIFQDKLRSDMDQLRRINRIIEWAQEVCDSDFLGRLNRYIFERGEKGDIASRGLKRISALMIRPSRDVGQLFRDQLERNPYLDPSFSAFERFAMRLFAIDPREGRELLSYLIFSPKYVRALLELGYEDARAQREQLIAFFEGGELTGAFPHITPAPAA
jgi:NTE family protein